MAFFTHQKLMFKDGMNLFDPLVNPLDVQQSKFMNSSQGVPRSDVFGELALYKGGLPTQLEIEELLRPLKVKGDFTGSVKLSEQMEFIQNEFIQQIKESFSFGEDDLVSWFFMKLSPYLAAIPTRNLMTENAKNILIDLAAVDFLSTIEPSELVWLVNVLEVLEDQLEKEAEDKNVIEHLEKKLVGQVVNGYYSSTTEHNVRKGDLSVAAGVYFQGVKPFCTNMLSSYLLIEAVSNMIKEMYRSTDGNEFTILFVGKLLRIDMELNTDLMTLNEMEHKQVSEYLEHISKTALTKQPEVKALAMQFPTLSEEFLFTIAFFGDLIANDKMDFPNAALMVLDDLCDDEGENGVWWSLLDIRNEGFENIVGLNNTESFLRRLLRLTDLAAQYEIYFGIDLTLRDALSVWSNARFYCESKNKCLSKDSLNFEQKKLPSLSLKSADATTDQQRMESAKKGDDLANSSWSFKYKGKF